MYKKYLKTEKDTIKFVKKLNDSELLMLAAYTCSEAAERKLSWMQGLNDK